MNFLIISEVKHKINEQRQVGAYAPYVKEMNLWAKYIDTITIVAPYSNEPFNLIELAYDHPSIRLVNIPFPDFTSPAKILKSAVRIPRLMYTMFREMRKTDHIHLRCPASTALFACFVQMFFPGKKKTAKYAGNWDRKSRQPFSRRLQQFIVSNTLLTRNMKVLVYGHWPGQTKNILPFFTASYTEKDKEPIETRTIGGKGKIILIFAGAFLKSKEPILAVKAAEMLAKSNQSVELNMFGDGKERQSLESYIAANWGASVSMLVGV